MTAAVVAVVVASLAWLVAGLILRPLLGRHTAFRDVCGFAPDDDNVSDVGFATIFAPFFLPVALLFSLIEIVGWLATRRRHTQDYGENAQ